jgi:hypothetical protein
MKNWSDSSEARNITTAEHDAREAATDVAIAALLLPRRHEHLRAKLTEISGALLLIANELKVELVAAEADQDARDAARWESL